MPKYDIVPMENQVVIVPAEAAKSVGRILLPDTVQEKPHWGTVLAIGPGKDGKTPLFKKGDTVLYNKYSGATITDLPDDKNEYRVITWENVMACLVEKK